MLANKFLKKQKILGEIFMKMGKMSVKICSIMGDLFFDIEFLKNNNFEFRYL